MRNGSMKCSASCTSFLACEAEDNILWVWLPSVLAGKALLSFRIDHTGGSVGCGSVSDPGKVGFRPRA